MTADEWVAQMLDRAPVATPEQVAKVAAILLPAQVRTGSDLPELVGAR